MTIDLSYLWYSFLHDWDLFSSIHDVVEKVLCFNMHRKETCTLLKRNQRSLVLLGSISLTKQYLVIFFGRFLLKCICAVELLSSVSLSTLLDLWVKWCKLIMISIFKSRFIVEALVLKNPTQQTEDIFILNYWLN